MSINKGKSKFKKVTDGFETLITENNIDVGDLKEYLINSFAITNDDLADKEKLDLSFEDAVDKYLLSNRFKHFARSTQVTYKTELKLLTRSVNNKMNKKGRTQLLKVLNPRFLTEYLEEHTNSTSTLNKKKAFLRSFIKIVEREYYEENHEDIDVVLKLNWEKNTLPKAFTMDQINELLKLSKFTAFGLRNYTMLMVFLSSGIRLDELKQLTIQDIDLNNKWLMVRRKRDKGNKQPAYITPEGLVCLMNYVSFMYGHLAHDWESLITANQNKAKYVFSHTYGDKPLSERTIQKMIKSVASKAESFTEEEFKQVHAHQFRHSFALYGLRAGINIYALKEFLGHKHLSSLESYLNQFNNQLQEDIERHPFANFKPTFSMEEDNE